MDNSDDSFVDEILTIGQNGQGDSSDNFKGESSSNLEANSCNIVEKYVHVTEDISSDECDEPLG